MTDSFAIFLDWLSARLAAEQSSTVVTVDYLKKMLADFNAFLHPPVPPHHH